MSLISLLLNTLYLSIPLQTVQDFPFYLRRVGDSSQHRCFWENIMENGKVCFARALVRAIGSLYRLVVSWAGKTQQGCALNLTADNSFLLKAMDQTVFAPGIKDGPRRDLLQQLCATAVVLGRVKSCTVFVRNGCLFWVGWLFNAA